MNRGFAAFDLDERADRRLVDGDDDVVGRELLAVLLVAKPDVEAELLKNRQQHVAVGDDGLTFLSQLHRARLHRALEGEQALAAFVAHAQHGTLPAKQLVVGVEQTVFLQAPAVERRGAERENLRSCLVGALEAELDLALERHVRYSLRTVTKVSWPPRKTSRNAVPFDGTCASARLASCGVRTGASIDAQNHVAARDAGAKRRAALLDVGHEHALGVGRDAKLPRHVRRSAGSA